MYGSPEAPTESCAEARAIFASAQQLTEDDLQWREAPKHKLCYVFGCYLWLARTAALAGLFMQKDGFVRVDDLIKILPRTSNDTVRWGG